MPAVRALALVVIVAAGTVSSPGGAPAQPVTFVGSTPCGSDVRRFLGIPDATCEQVTWDLAFGESSSTERSFELRARYHRPVPGSPNHLDAGTPLQVRGGWKRAEGPGGRTTYHLDIDGRSISLALLERDLLHVLTPSGRLMVGNGGWSYTLNRRETSGPRPRAMQPLATVPAGIGGEYEGRTPCQEIAKQLDLAVDAGCTKLKWGITLVQDASGRPATYKHEGTLYRNGSLYGAPPRTGAWSVLRDPATGALVYRLERGEPGKYLQLLRADENILVFLDEDGGVLVGNTSHSYTLNRRGPPEPR